MVESQSCAAAAADALDEPSACPLPHSQASNKPPGRTLAMSRHRQDSSGAFHHSSEQQNMSEQVVRAEGSGGGRPLEEDDERGGGGASSSSSLDRGVRSGGKGGGARQALKGSRLAVEEDDQLSIPPMDLSGPNDYGPPFFHHPYQLQQRQLYPHPHHYPAVDASSSFHNTHQLHSHSQQHQQQVSADQNGYHATASAHMESSRYGVGDSHMMPDGGSHLYQGGLWNPQLPGQMPGQGPALVQGLNVGEVLAELERERKKNAELQGRLNSLEARLGGSILDKHGPSFQNGGKKSKKHRRSSERTTGEGESEESRKISRQPDESSAMKEEEGVELHVTLPLEDPSQTDGQTDTRVTWMSREEVTPAELEKLSKDIVSDRDDSGDSDDDDEDEEDDEDELEDDEDGEGGGAKKKRKSEGEQQQVWNAIDGGVDADRGVLDLTEDGEKSLPGGTDKIAQVQDGFEGMSKTKRRKSSKERKGKQGEKVLFSKRGFGCEMVSFRGPGIMSSYKKAPKTAFCPKEVKRIMESGVLALKNAQSHTMRKIIVFASLGIRHGCEDLYELDFSNFSVVRRGEPYKSPKDPGEHVLYDQCGVRTKIFYPNKQNPVLCPVRILDEEKAMRPAGLSCPTCLFLCIKYGGRTRNLPQNEYVRQRMGRNKLKSFGPLMCQMALLVHIRTGSFFFKALGITLLFMAGFPDDLVRKETKYRNLDLLQKYYRSDEDAKGEQLFHPYPTFYPPAMMVAPPPTHKTPVPAKGTSKKGPPPLLSKPPFTPAVPRYMTPLATRSPPAMPFQGMAPPFPPPLASISPGLPASASAPRHSSPPGPPAPPPPPPFGMYPPYHPPMHQGGFLPMPWAPLQSYAASPYPPTPFAFQPFSAHSPHFLPPFYGPPYRFPPYGQESTVKEKKEAEESGDSDSDSDSGSSGAGKQVSEKGNNKEGLSQDTSSRK